jgi:hypothetical protein
MAQMTPIPERFRKEAGESIDDWTKRKVQEALADPPKHVG